jgi:hypothetical protein
MLDLKGSTYDYKQTTLLSSSPRTIEFRKNLALAELELSRAIGLCVVAVAYYICTFTIVDIISVKNNYYQLHYIILHL